MTWRSEPIPPVPETTATAVRAAFPKGNLYVDLREEFGSLYRDELFADFYSNRGHPVEVAPWRLALVTVMQYIEGLTDRQSADAVRRCMDWKYALSLELTDPGFNFTELHDFRQRLLSHDGAQCLLDTFLDTCKERGWIKARGQQRTDSTYVVAAIRRLYYLECVQEAMHHALNQLSEAAPEWVREWAPLEWYERYGPRADLLRLPKETSKRNALALVIGADGYQLMDWLWHDASARPLCDLPAVEILRQIWIQHYYRCTEPGMEELRWRDTADQPPTAQIIQSPYDLDARYGTKRDMNWVGYKVHLSETCDEGQPDLITQVTTTLATTSDFVMGEPIEQDLADRNLLPGIHLVDSGYVVADLLVSGPRMHQIDVMGPPLSSSSRQNRENQGYDLHSFVIDWEAQQAPCPQGHHSVKWSPGYSPWGHPVIRIRFDKATCLACAMRAACTSSKEASRQITVKPQAQHEAIQAARKRQETAEFKTTYALRAGVESTISQGARRFDLRRSRYIGLARTHLQQTINATAMNLVRVADWLRKGRSTQPKRPPGHFARLAPQLTFGLAACVSTAAAS
jgi:transposase